MTKRLLTNKKFRELYVWEQLKRSLPFQLRTMRDERDWSQERAGEAISKPQSVISRLESPNYGKVSVQTLLEIANGFDVGLLIKFVPFSRLVREYDDVSYMVLSAKSVSDPMETAKLTAWAADAPVVQDDTKTNTQTFEAGTEKTTSRIDIVIARKPFRLAVASRGTAPARRIA